MPTALASWLDSAGSPARFVVADDVGAARVAGADDAAAPWPGLVAGDLVVARSRDPFALALLRLAESCGARSLDSWSAVARVRNKLRCAEALAKCDVPVPATLLVRRPEDLAALPLERFPLVVKPVLGDNARGVLIVRSPDELDEVASTEELLLAQRYVDVGGVDLKIYVAGDDVWAVRRPSPLSAAADDPLPADVTPELTELVERCRPELRLRLFGLDVVEAPEGPVVVDVNEFPNYTGVDEAPEAIGRTVLEVARGETAARRPVVVPA